VKHTSAWAIWLKLHADVVDESLRSGTPTSPTTARNQMLPRFGFFRTPSARQSSSRRERSQSFQLFDDSERDITDMILSPVASLKRFELWNWALRFDEVAFSRQTEREQKMSFVGNRNQCLGRSLVRMMRNAAVCACKECRCDFGMTRWPHHCRGCGLIFCSACLAWKAQLDETSTQEQVCSRCFEISRDRD